jgi:hypothetical protein
MGQKPYKMLDKPSPFAARQKSLPTLDASASLKTTETNRIIIVFTRFWVFSYVSCHRMELLFVTTFKKRRPLFLLHTC